jgi:CRISPR/Cas system CMR subunit Cmr6 (Cas7 group RAMP superfamily)
VFATHIVGRDKDLVLKGSLLLEQAASYVGVGAKGAAGYGYGEPLDGPRSL